MRQIQYYFSKVMQRIIPPAIKNSSIDISSKVCSRSEIIDSSIGRFSYVGRDCRIIHTKIGAFVSIANNVVVGGASHPMSWATMSPLFYSGKNIFRKHFGFSEYESYTETTIGNDVWIGDNVIIKAGVTVDNGAVIGMGSVVTKSIGQYEIWAGNPARFIRKRFSDETISRVNNLHWWDFSDAELSEIGNYVNDIEIFINECEILRRIK